MYLLFGSYPSHEIPHMHSHWLPNNPSPPLMSHLDQSNERINAFKFVEMSESVRLSVEPVLCI